MDTDYKMNHQSLVAPVQSPAYWAFILRIVISGGER